MRRRLSTGLLELWPFSSYAAASVAQSGALTVDGGLTAGQWNASGPGGIETRLQDPSWGAEDSGCALAGSALGFIGEVPGTVAVDVHFAGDGSGRCLITTYQEGVAGSYDSAGLAGRRMAAGSSTGDLVMGGSSGTRVPSLGGASALPHEWVPGFRFHAFAARVPGTSPLGVFSRIVSRGRLADAEAEAEAEAVGIGDALPAEEADPL